MNATVVVTQAELEAAIEANAGRIELRPKQPTEFVVHNAATVTAYDSATVTACDSATVWAYGSATVWAHDSATVRASGSATVWAYDSATVWASGSATVTASGSATVTAYDSATVTAYDSATVTASRYVAVHRKSANAICGGGHIIDTTNIDETDPAAWCDYHSVFVVDGVATLYKAVEADCNAGHRYTVTSYQPDTFVQSDDWRDDNDCGGGLHFSPTTHQATFYNPAAVRWMKVEVPVADLRPIPGDVAKCKAPACRVVCEVDADGNEVTP